ncbi:MAG: hypothetical protein Q7S99_05245 [Parvibaculum sp.]|nr:hypothetical protein [Parvibaculum sp.]
MIRQLFLAAILAVGVSGIATSTPAMAEVNQEALASEISVVEGYVLQFQDDPDGLQLAIETYVTGATDPELAASAVIAVYGHSTNPSVVQLLLENSELKAALGKGLGAAIALIGVTNPDLATLLAALVTAEGDDTLTAAVDSGNDSKTASILQQQRDRDGALDGDSTPEQTGSAS